MTEKELDEGIEAFWAEHRPPPPPRPNTSAGTVLLIIAAITFIFWILFGEVR